MKKLNNSNIVGDNACNKIFSEEVVEDSNILASQCSADTVKIETDIIGDDVCNEIFLEEDNDIIDGEINDIMGTIDLKEENMEDFLEICNEIGDIGDEIDDELKLEESEVFKLINDRFKKLRLKFDNNENVTDLLTEIESYTRNI